MDKSVMGLKLSKIMNSDFIKNKYKEETIGMTIEEKEKYMARTFNMAFLFLQLSPDEKLCEEFINKMVYRNSSISEYPDVMAATMLMSIMTGLSEEEIAECLKHGVAIHFTTPKIAEKIKSDGEMSNLYSNEDIGELMQAMRSTNPDSQYVFTTGFGIKKGVCAGNITTAYYMFHTPETLSFLYGGNFINGNYEAAMEHVRLSTENMEPGMREKLIKKLENLYRATTSKDTRTAILIDRDKLEYKKDNYYKDGKIDRQVERRPYRDGNLYDMCEIEMNLIEQKIPLDALFFVNIPSIEKLDREIAERENDKEENKK